MPQTNKFEVAIYNDRVRMALRTGERNRTGFKDEWGDTRYIEILADTKEIAISKVLARYPEHRGFVVEDVKQIYDPE